jgi:hypothetical protein
VQHLLRRLVPWCVALALPTTSCGPKLEQRLLAEDDATRTAALGSLKELSASKREELVPTLVGKLDTTRAVGAPGDKESIAPALGAQAEQTLEAQAIRRRALAALAVVGAPSVKPLVGVVSDANQRPWVRADVAKALGEIGEPAKEAEPVLERAFAETRDERLKLNSAAVLVLFGRRDAAYLGELERCKARCDGERKAYADEVLAKVASR